MDVSRRNSEKQKQVDSLAASEFYLTAMHRMKQKLKGIMTTGDERRFLFFQSFLYSLSIAYGSLIKLRETLYKKGVFKAQKLPCPVISVGNITLGGTGKTPMTIYVAELIKRLGYHVVVISRGYKGTAENVGGVVSDGHSVTLGPEQAGDEPFMMAQRLKKIPVVVGKNRYKSGMLAIQKFNPDVLLLDDAFQHLQLKRDLDLVLLDSNAPFGNTYLFPRGTLRETAVSLARGGAVILTRSDIETPALFDQIKKLAPGLPIFSSVHTPYIHKIVSKSQQKDRHERNITFNNDFDIFKKKRIFAFSGIARNDDFQRTLESFECDLAGFIGYPDHYRYSDKELTEILRSATAQSADYIFTTEKDFVRIVQPIQWPIDLVVVGINISFKKDANAFDEFLSSRLGCAVKRKPNEQAATKNP